ncbi:holin [Sporosarcina sp. FSL K6-1508]|uniref:holin n=1 Tax=Sporosarcina sp. FSL K6-1508 TaxID=2921553 RepID=UPI0030FB244B
MAAVLIFATVLAPVILAAVQLAKQTMNIKKNYIPLIAFVIGIAIGFAASPFTELDLTLRLWAGGLAGLSATGLFELGNKHDGNTKENE